MLKEKIEGLIQGEVADDKKTLLEHSEDASIFHIEPDLVVFPRSVKDVENLVSFVSREKRKNKDISISPRSAGTDMTGGSLTESIVASFTKYFNRIKEITKTGTKEGYAVVEPGAYYRDFERETLKKDLLFPPYPASRELCAMGGIVSNNSAGEKTLSCGQTKDYVLGLKMVMADGKEHSFFPLSEKDLKKKIAKKDFEGRLFSRLFSLIKKNQKIIDSAKPKVSKNSSGYFLWDVWDGKTFDITKLLVGSQGTLGILTEAKIRLVAVKPHTRMVVIFLKDLAPLGKLVNSILESKPESLESYDDKTLLLALKFLPGLIKSLLSKGQNLIKLFIQFLPDFWTMVTFGFPKLVLIAEFAGDNENEVIEKTKKLLVKIKAEGYAARMTKSKEDGEKYWTIRRESFNLLRQKVKDKHTVPFIDDVIVAPEKVPEFIPRLNSLIEKYPELTYTIAGHAGNGNFHVIPLADFRNPNLKNIVKKLSEEVYDLVREFEGSITAEHNDGLIRTPFLGKIYRPEVLKLFKEVKKIFDPQNIFNPGKKVGGDLGRALQFIKKE